MKGSMKHLFILNPRSFLHSHPMDGLVSRIHGFFKSAGSGDYLVHISRFPRDAVGFIRSYADTLAENTSLRVYAAGGDGILFDCLNGIMGLGAVSGRQGCFSGQTELAAMPYGRRNNFLRGFGKKNMPLFRDISLQYISRAIPLDVISDGANFALSSCLVGTEAMASVHAGKLQSRLENGGIAAKWFSILFYEWLFYAGGIKACFNKKLLQQQYTVTIDGEDCGGAYRSINIANAPFYGSAGTPVRAAMPNDEMLNILFARGRNTLRTLYQIPLYLSGRFEASGDFYMRRGKKISIGSESPVCYKLDDMVFFDKKLALEALPGAVRFVDVTGRGYTGGALHE
jgi:diacylglycerol kinase family enzyme